MINTIITYSVVSTILMALVQIVKKQSKGRGWNPLIILAVLSVIGGIVYALLMQFELWEFVVAKVLIVASAANMIYNVLKQIDQTINPSDNNV